MSRQNATVVVFTRPVIAGQTKTRLIERYGAYGAADLARAFLLDTYAMALNLRLGRTVVSVAEPGPLPAFRPAAEVWRQGPGDLGARMSRMARRALGLGSSFVIIIGSDSPGLPGKLLESAISALETGAAAVLGPAEDGGFYLLGLRRCPAGLLAELPWSTPETARLTSSRLGEHGMAPQWLPPWFDIDSPEDVERLRQLLARNQVHAPQTKTVLMPLGCA